MTDKLIDTGNRGFSMYTILVAVLISIQLICFIYARRQVDIFHMPVNASGVIFPLDIYLIEIIGECYGYEYSRQAVWINTSIHILFSLIVLVISTIPYSTFMHKDLIFSYKHLVDISWVVALGSLVGTFSGDLFSARVVPQTKLILNGKHVFIRLFFAQSISETIVTSSYFLSFFTNNYPFLQILHLVINTILIKIILALLLWPLTNILIHKIKQIEQIEGFDFQQDYKTLAFAIRNEKINLRGIYNITK